MVLQLLLGQQLDAVEAVGLARGGRIEEDGAVTLEADGGIDGGPLAEAKGVADVSSTRTCQVEASLGGFVASPGLKTRMLPAPTSSRLSVAGSKSPTTPTRWAGSLAVARCQSSTRIRLG